MMQSALHIVGVSRLICLSLFLVWLCGVPAAAQQNIFQMFGDDVTRGDEYFRQGSYRHALKEYLSEGKKASSLTRLKIARSFYHIHDYRQSAAYFREVAALVPMESSDRFMFAEALAANGHYDEAVLQYQEFLKHNPEDELAKSKIWRLKNIRFLFEDSLHFSVRKLGMSSPYSEFGAVPYENGIVFLSNRKGAGTFDESDALTGEHFFRLYTAGIVRDPQTNLFNVYGKVLPFKGLEARIQNGPLMFFDSARRVVFVRTNPGKKGGKSTLQMFFAARASRGWEETGAFPYNSDAYNVSEPWISEDGSSLYFSSDMKGGEGGKDIYKCEFKNGRWSSPENLGSGINTRFDESFPHFFRSHLYFSSNGHAGMGGLDVFKAPATGDGFGEVSNPGYPLNSSGDDFGFFFRHDGDGAYLTSNRGGTSDDLYEIEIDLQSYPLMISGVLKAREFSVTDSALIRILPRTRMYLVDHSREIIIDEVVTDERGFFRLTIPYFSQYKIKVKDDSGNESVVSLQIPRQKKADDTHEIVVVKDAFHTPQE